MKKYSPNESCIVMTREQVRAFDRWAINELNIPGMVLMENAGQNCVELIDQKLTNIAKPTVCIFCGTGNNGGDGYVIARGLLNKGYKVTAVLCGDRGKIKGDAKTNLDILEKMGQPIDQLNLAKDDIRGKVEAFTAGADMIVDSLFGTGLAGQLNDEYKDLIDRINTQNCPILAVDIPSGLDCDTGQLLGAAVRAAYTVTFVAVKTGFISTPKAAQYTGEVFVASIGIDPSAKGLDC